MTSRDVHSDFAVSMSAAEVTKQVLV